jgi:hypothetical protein
MLTRVPANVVGAQRERSLEAKVLKAATGWGLLDQHRYGVLGGPGSVLNDPCGTFCNAVFGVTWKPSWAPKPLDP